MMCTLFFSSHGALRRRKSWNGEASPTLESPPPSNAVSVQSKRSKAHSTVFTQCPITTSCALWDSRSGSDATAFTDMTEPPSMIEAQTAGWQTWRTRIITHASESGTRPRMLALITLWGSWWSCRMLRRLRTFGRETWATAKSECSPPFLMPPMPPKGSPTHIDDHSETDNLSILSNIFDWKFKFYAILPYKHHFAIISMIWFFGYANKQKSLRQCIESLWLPTLVIVLIC